MDRKQIARAYFDRVALRLRWNAAETGYTQYGIVVFRFEGDRIAERWSAYMSAA